MEDLDSPLDDMVAKFESMEILLIAKLNRIRCFILKIGEFKDACKNVCDSIKRQKHDRVHAIQSSVGPETDVSRLLFECNDDLLNIECAIATVMKKRINWLNEISCTVAEAIGSLDDVYRISKGLVNESALKDEDSEVTNWLNIIL
jgi:hypothetical protein